MLIVDSDNVNLNYFATAILSESKVTLKPFKFASNINSFYFTAFYSGTS